MRMTDLPSVPAPRRRLAIALVVAIGVVISLALSVLLESGQREQSRLHFERHAPYLASRLETTLRSDREVVQSIASFWAASTEVDRNEFHVFTASALSRHPHIQALEWVPRVTEERRAEYEAAARADGLGDFQFTERSEQGQLVRAVARPEYYPVYYVEPLAGNQSALGYDLASEPVRKEALDRARDTAEPAATGRISLVQEQGRQDSYLLFFPIYRKGSYPSSVEERRADLEGFALAVFRIGDLVERVLGDEEPLASTVYLYDESMSPPELLFPSVVPPNGDLRKGFEYSTKLAVGGRTWGLWIQGADEQIPGWLSPMPIGALIAGLLLTATAAAYLHEVLTRTEELSRWNALLKASEQRYRKWIDSSPDAVAVVRDGIVVLANPAAERLFGGAAAGQLSGRPLLDFVRPDYAAVASRITRWLEKGDRRMPSIRGEFLRPDGTPVYAEVTAASTLFGGEQTVLFIARDVAQRRQAEQALRESEERFRRAILGAPLPVMIHAEDGEVLLLSNAWTEVSGYSLREIPTTTAWIEKAHGHQIDTLKEIISGLYELRDRTHVGEDEIITATGNVRVWDFTAAPLGRLPDGRRLVISMAVDITDRRHLEKQLLQAQRLEAAGQVAAQVAHDFSNLLVPLMAYPELIKLRLSPDHPATPLCDTMMEAARHLADISADLMALGRRGRLELEPTDLNLVVQQAIECTQPQPTGLSMRVDLAPGLPTLSGNPSQLLRLLTNLITNAREAMEDNGTLTVSTEHVYVDRPLGRLMPIAVGEYVKLSVSDTGCGIPPEIRDKIFDAFFTTKTGDRRRGSGLGLAIVRSVVDDHRGYLDMETEVGVGTTFSLYLPVSASPTAVPTTHGLPTGDETVLVVDDDRLQRDAMTSMLETQGYRVFAVGSGEEAIAYLKEHRVGLVILDMIMPGGIDGAETYRRALEVAPGQRALLVSGFALPERVNYARSLGPVLFLQKPVSLETLARTVRTELDRDRGQTSLSWRTRLTHWAGS